MLYGVDVSVYQSSAMIPHGVDFVLARATYGRSQDKRAESHVEVARKLEAKVGLYSFFVPTQSPLEQLAAFDAVADRCGLTVGDIIPWVDVESYPAGGGVWVQPQPEWCAALQTVVAGMRRTWGACGVYITSRDWSLLGKPQWLLDLPIWVAHWVGEWEPASPDGRPWAIHQYRVGPYSRGAAHVVGQHDDPGAIDHDRAESLPLITAAHTRPGVLEGPPPTIDLYAEAADVRRRDGGLS